MHKLGATAHALIDYVLVILLAIAPAVAGFRGKQATIAWILAAVLFILNATTRHPLGIVKAVRFPLHGVIELLLGLLVLVLPWLAGFSAGVHSRNFFAAFGVLLLIHWAITDYRTQHER